MTAPATALSTPTYGAQPPQFPQSVGRRSAVLTAALTGTVQSPTNDTPLVEVGHNPAGVLSKRIYVMAQATNVACVVYLYRTGLRADGTSVKVLEDCVSVPAATYSTTAGPVKIAFPDYTPSNPLHASKTDIFSAVMSVANASGIVVVMETEPYAVNP